MRRRTWVAGVLGAGVLLVGVVVGLAWAVKPDGPLRQDWPLFAGALLAPYVLAAVGCSLTDDSAVRVIAAFIAVVGLGLLGVALFDMWPAFQGGTLPAMPVSALVAGVGIIAQLVAGVLAFVGGLIGQLEQNATGPRAS